MGVPATIYPNKSRLRRPTPTAAIVGEAAATESQPMPAQAA